MSFQDITFAHPWLLLLLLAVPVIAWLRGRRGQQAAFLYSSVQLVKSIIGFHRRFHPAEAALARPDPVDRRAGPPAAVRG